MLAFTIIAIVLAVVAVLTLIMFKFHAIKDGITKYGGMLIDYFKKLPEFLKEKWDIYSIYWSKTITRRQMGRIYRINYGYGRLCKRYRW